MKPRDHHNQIIIAASEEPLLRVLRHTLLSVGLGADVARSHRELVRMCSHNCYRLIISRFLSPLISSPESIARLRGQGLTTHLFLLSHTRDQRIVVMLLEHGVNQFLSLPVSGARLVGKVLREVENRRPQCW